MLLAAVDIGRQLFYSRGMKSSTEFRLAHCRIVLLAAGLLLISGVSSLLAQPGDIRIVAPYAGWVTSVYEREHDPEDIELKDTDLMLGLYAQWIRPRSFQANVFLYHAPDVNYASLWGLHSNLDFYFNAGPVQNLVAGGGLELITINIDAGDNVEPLQDFELQTSVVAPFLRAGKQFPLANDWAELVIFPWAGAELDFVRGDLSFFVPFPFPGQTVKTDLDETDLYALAGINLRSTLLRFLQLDAKYSAAFDPHSWYPRASLMTNVFLTRQLGLSYRFSYMQTSAGSTMYNIFGVVAMF